MLNDLLSLQRRFDLRPYLSQTRDMVNQWLEMILKSLDRSRLLVQAIEYSLMAKGKRIRPILAIAAAQACKKNIANTMPVCCAIEMIHTYSLIHDDLPAMDDDDIRRGRPACHKKFSETTAILVGDALLTHAFQILSRPKDIFDVHLNPLVMLDIIFQIASAAGLNGMIEGQMLDMQSEKCLIKKQNQKDADELLKDLKHLHSLKTGRMIAASVVSGALSVNALDTQQYDLAKYADHIGLAYQIMDDILNLEGNPEIMGKATGSDIHREKMTFPALLGLKESKIFADRLVMNAIEILNDFGEQADPLRAIAWYITHREK